MAPFHAGYAAITHYATEGSAIEIRYGELFSRWLRRADAVTRILRFFALL